MFNISNVKGEEASFFFGMRNTCLDPLMNMLFSVLNRITVLLMEYFILLLEYPNIFKIHLVTSNP